jgi:hypothetical protein
MKITITAQYLTWSSAKGEDTRIKRLNLEASNGATARLIWEYPNTKPSFLGENMNREQLQAGKKAQQEIMLAKLNGAASTLDLFKILQDGGWDSIYPVP